VLFEIISDSLL